MKNALMMLPGTNEQREETQLATREQAQQLSEMLAKLSAGQQAMQAAILAQAEEIAKLNRALALIRVSRTQETAIGEAVRARAKAIARSESLPGMEKKIAGAIRVTIREVTGARAVGDIQAGQFERVMELVQGWYMAGKLRRMRKEAEGCDTTATRK